MGQKIVSYVKAEVSLVLKGPVSKEELVKRLETCNGCENLERSEAEGELGWCSKCGCGRAARAELTVKGRMPAATCPHHLWIKEGAPRAPLSEELRRAIDA